MFSPILGGSLLPDYEVGAALAVLLVLVAGSYKGFITLHPDFYLAVIPDTLRQIPGRLSAFVLAYEYEKFVGIIIFQSGKVRPFEAMSILEAVNYDYLRALAF